MPSVSPTEILRAPAGRLKFIVGLLLVPFSLFCQSNQVASSYPDIPVYTTESDISIFLRGKAGQDEIVKPVSGLPGWMKPGGPENHMDNPAIVSESEDEIPVNLNRTIYHAPSFASDPVTLLSEEQLYIYNIRITSPDGSAYNVTGNFPSWLSLNADQGQEVTTIAGSYQSTFTDGTGTEASFSNPYGIDVDNGGNVYIADYNYNRIRKISPSGEVTTLAGSGLPTYQDGLQALAAFNKPSDLVVDASGTVFVSDQDNYAIRKVTASGQVSTLAGGNGSGTVDGAGTIARFGEIKSLDIDDEGNLYVADRGNRSIRKISPEGLVSTFAGSGALGSADGTGTNASFGNLEGIVLDNDDNLYVTDGYARNVRKITSAGVVTTLAGSGSRVTVDGTGTEASFFNLNGIDVDDEGNVYVAEYSRGTIRKITPEGVVTSVVGGDSGVDAVYSALGIVWEPGGTIYATDAIGNHVYKVRPDNVIELIAGGASGTLRNGALREATLDSPHDLVIDELSGNIFFTERGNHVIRKISPDGQVSTFAGSGTMGFADGSPEEASFNFPAGIVINSAGYLFVADIVNNRIRMINPNGNVSTFAGSGEAAYADGTGEGASFNGPRGLEMDADGNLYVSDMFNARIRKVTPDGVVTTLAGSGVWNFQDGTGTEAAFVQPMGLSMGPDGDLYVADQGNNRIRKITSGGVVTTVAGSGSFGSEDGAAGSASFANPENVLADDQGNIYVAERSRIRLITPDGTVSTFAGSGNAGATDGTGTSATLGGPFGMVFNAEEDILVADEGSHLIRKVSVAGVSLTGEPTGQAGTHEVSLTVTDGNGGSSDQNFTVTVTDNQAPEFTSTPGTGVEPNASYKYKVEVEDANGDAVTISAPVLPDWLSLTSQMVITTIAGGNGEVFREGTGTEAGFRDPRDLVVDRAGNAYIADSRAHVIRKVDKEGVVTTFAGEPFDPGITEGTGTAARLAGPIGLAIDAEDNLYVASSGYWASSSSRIYKAVQKISPDGEVSLIAGGYKERYEDGSGTDAAFTYPNALTMDDFGNLYMVDNLRIRKITQDGLVTTLAGNGSTDGVNGTGTLASFETYPEDIVTDKAGNVYVSDGDLIRKITPEGVMTTYAGFDGSGYVDGALADARFNRIGSLSRDNEDNIYVGDDGNYRIRKIDTNGMVSTIAGQGTFGQTDGPVDEAYLNPPSGLFAKNRNAIFMIDHVKESYRKIVLDHCLEGAPGQDFGDHNVTLRAEDGNGGTAMQSFIVTAFDETPRVINVSSDFSNGTYGYNNLMRVYIEFDEIVLVTGTPQLALETGEVDGTMDYESGSGSKVLTFRYVVEGGDFTTDLAYKSVNALSAGESIKGENGKDAILTLPSPGSEGSLSGNKDISLNAIPNVTAVLTQTEVTEGKDENISYRINFSHVSKSTVTLEIEVSGSATRGQDYASFFIDLGTEVFPPNYGGGTYGLQISDDNLREGDENIIIEVRSITNAVLTSPAQAVLNIIDDEVFVFTSSSEVYFEERGSGVVYQAEVTDANADRVQFSLGDAGDEAQFAIDQSTGEVTFKTAPDFDSPTDLDQNNQYDIQIKAGDGTYEDTWSVSVFVTKILDSDIMITTRPELEVTHGEDYAYHVRAIDANGGTIQYEADLPSWLSLGVPQAGESSIIAGSARSTFADGTGTESSFFGPTGVDVDAAGNIYVADSFFNRIRKITPQGVVTTIAGTGLTGFTQGPGTEAKLFSPTDLVLDDAGNIYFVESLNRSIRKISPSGVISVVAGPLVREEGYTDGTGTEVRFGLISAIDIDAQGNLYAADRGNRRIRKITPEGVVSTLAGSGNFTHEDGTGTLASFMNFSGLTVGADGNIYTTDFFRQAIRKTTQEGVVTTFVGSGDRETVDGTGTSASFANIGHIDSDASGNLYVTDKTDQLVRKVTPEGVVTTIMGGSSPVNVNVLGEYALNGIAIDSFGNIITSDNINNRIYKLNTSNMASVVAGGQKISHKDGPALEATFNFIYDVVTDSKGNMYVADGVNHVIRKISKDGVVSTFAGSGEAGNADGTGTQANFNGPRGIALFDDSILYVADTENNSIRRIDIDGVVTTLAGSGLAEFSDGTGTNASFNFPIEIETGAEGLIYVADYRNHRIRKITPEGVVTTLAGSGNREFADGTGSLASFNYPFDIAIDADNNVFVGDDLNKRVRKVTPEGVVTTFAGNDTRDQEDGSGTEASFRSPRHLVFDKAGNLYVTDNGILRGITPNGEVSSFARMIEVEGEEESTLFDGGLGNLAVDHNGDLIIAELGNFRIRRISPSGVVISGKADGTVGEHEVSIDVANDFGGTDQQIFTITVVDKTAPMFTSAESVDYAENRTDVAYTATATDNDVNAVITYSLGTGNDESLFNIDGTTGELSFIVPPDFEIPTDADTDNNYVIQLMASDGLNEVGQLVTISVTDVLEDITPPNKPLITGISDDTGISDSDGITNDRHIEISGKAEPLATVEVSTQYGPLRSVQADAQGDWLLDITDITLVEIKVNLTAEAVDQAGNRSQKSDAFALTPDFTAPARPVITGISEDTGKSDSDGITNDKHITVKGTAEPLSMVEVSTQFGPLRNAETDVNGEWVLDITDITLVELVVDLTAKAVDLAGNRSAASDSFELTPDFTAPAKPVITGITEDTGRSDIDGVTNDKHIIISGTAEPNSEVEVSSQYGTLRSTQTDANGDWLLDITDITLLEIQVRLTAESIDLAGNHSQKSDVFVLTPDFTAPARPVIVGISDDTGGSSTNGVTNDKNITINGTAEPLSMVEVSTQYGPLRSVQVDGQGDWLLDITDITLVELVVNLTARAVDLAGNRSLASDPFVLTPDFTPPAKPVITGISEDTGSSSTDGVTNDKHITISGTAEPDSRVEVSSQYGPLRSTQTDTDGNWLLDITDITLFEIKVNLIAEAIDLAGNRSAGSDVFTLTPDFTAPGVTISIESSTPTGHTIIALFDEEVNELSLEKISVTGGIASDLVQTSTTSYSFLITRTENIADVMIGAGAVEDLAGNPNTDSNQLTLNTSSVPAGDIVTGLPELAMVEEVRVYPNPASEILNIDLSELSTKEVNIYLYNAAGIPVYKRELYKDKKLQMDVSDYPSGMYILHLNNGARSVRKKVMVKK